MLNRLYIVAFIFFQICFTVTNVLFAQVSNVQDSFYLKFKEQIEALCIEKNYQKSLTLCIQEIEKNQKEKNIFKEANATKLLGNTYYHMSRSLDAEREWQRAIMLAKQSNNVIVAQNCYHNLGALNIEKADYKNGEKHLLIALNYASKRGAEGNEDYFRHLRLLGTLYGITKQLQRADSLFHLLFINKNIIANKVIYLTAKTFFSKVLCENNQIERGLKISDSCLIVARKIGEYDLLTTIISIHIENLTQAKKFKEAFFLEKEISQLEKTKYLKIVDKNISDAEVKFHTSQIEHDKELSIIKSKKEWLMLLFISFIAIVFIIGYFLFIQQKRKLKANENMQQEKILSLLEGEEKEKRRVAKELHDGIVQQLTALKFQLNIFSKGENESAINKNYFEKEIDQMNQDIRSISYQMMPVTLKELGLPKAIEDAMERVLKPSNISYHFESVGFENRFPENLEVNLFRIAQEILNNIIKHSRATHVEVTIVFRNNKISLLVEDNGIGMPEGGALKEGIGLFSIKSRLSAIKGQIRFDSNDTGGTSIRINVNRA